MSSYSSAQSFSGPLICCDTPMRIDPDRDEATCGRCGSTLSGQTGERTPAYDPIREALVLAVEVLGDLADEVGEHPHNAPWFSPTHRAQLAKLVADWQQLLTATAEQPARDHSPEGQGVEISILLAEFRRKHAALHREWTAAAAGPGYVKAPWRDRDNALVAEYRKQLAPFGYFGPLLADAATRSEVP